MACDYSLYADGQTTGDITAEDVQDLHAQAVLSTGISTELLAKLFKRTFSSYKAPVTRILTTPTAPATKYHGGACYDPPQFFLSLSDPLLVTLSMPKQPLPLNPSFLPDLPPLPPSKPLSPLDQPPVEPLIPVPWNIHHWEYSSMEMYQEPPPVENPLEDPDSPMEDAPPLEPEPFIPYEPDVPGGNMHALSPEESPVIPWQEYLAPDSPVSRKHSLSPTSSSSAPIHQRTSREGSYQSITPSASSPIAGTSPQS